MRIGDQVGTAQVNVLNAPAPALLGMDFLAKAEAFMDFSQGDVIFKKLSTERHPLKRHPLKQQASGHLAVRLASDTKKARSHGGTMDTSSTP